MKSESTPRETARKLTLELLKEGIPELTGNLSRVLARLEDPDLRLGMLDAITQEKDKLDINQLWLAWDETRHPDLEQLLIHHALHATSSVQLLVTSHLKLGHLDELASSTAELVPSLLQASQDPDSTIAKNSFWVLRHLQDPSAHEEICRWVIEHNHPVAREIALEMNYFPRDPHQRALFFLLTEQWERYENLDFDASLLSALYQAAGHDLRSQISSFALRSGWSGYVHAMTQSRLKRKLSDLNDDEWQAVLALLSRDRRWNEMWRLAQSAPVERSAQILRELNDLDWQPENSTEKKEFRDWVFAAQQCLLIGKPTSRFPGDMVIWSAHSRPVTCLCIHPQGHLLASGSTDQQVCIWQSADGALVHRLQSHSANIQSLAASPDGVFLASGSADRSVRIWNFENGDLIHVLGGHAGEIASLAFSSDTRLLASGDANQVRIWDIETGKLVKQFPMVDGPVKQLAFESAKSFLLASGQTSLSILSLAEEMPPTLIPERVRSWQLLEPCQTGVKETRLVTSSSYKKIRLWSIPAGQQLAAFEGLADGENLCASLDDQFIIASERNLLRRWEIETGKHEVDLEGHTGRITCLLYNPQGKFLLSAGEEGSIRLWQNRQARSMLIKDKLPGPVFSIKTDRSGLHVAFAEQNRITVCKLVDLDMIFRQPLESIRPELLAEAETLFQSLPETPVELSWLNLIHLSVKWRRRYDIEIGETIPAIAIGSYDIQID